MIYANGRLYHERLRSDGHWAADGLRGLWYMNAMTGTAVADLSADGLPLVLEGTAAWHGTPLGGGVNFPAAGDPRLQVASFAHPTGTNQLTVAALICLDTVGVVQQALRLGGTDVSYILQARYEYFQLVVQCLLLLK